MVLGGTTLTVAKDKTETKKETEPGFFVAWPDKPDSADLRDVQLVYVPDAGNHVSGPEMQKTARLIFPSETLDDCLYFEGFGAGFSVKVCIEKGEVWADRSFEAYTWRDDVMLSLETEVIRSHLMFVKGTLRRVYPKKIVRCNGAAVNCKLYGITAQ